MPHHHFNHQRYLYTNISHAHGAPAHLKQQVLPNCFWILPAVACKSSRERKQIETAPFMMAARRTLIVTQTIYTKAGRLKCTERERRGGIQRWPAGGGAEICVCSRCYRSLLCHRDSTCASSWLFLLLFSGRLQLRPRHKCTRVGSILHSKFTQLLTNNIYHIINARDLK